MGNTNAISDAGLTLIELLREKMVPDPIVQPEYIGLGTPADPGDLNLLLFLYNVTDSESRSNEMIADARGSLQYPPLEINLHFLLTAFSSADAKSKMLDEHRMMGKAMQVLYDHSAIRGAALKGTLLQNNEELRVRKEDMPMEGLQNIWNFSDTPFRLFVPYIAGPIRIESTRTKAVKRVTRTDFTVQG
ncbi:DUF4255 domain-containing protein [Marinicrinis sediminis]|uniref:DUF4255 domain-containing protein n=1 Tax=Marinicrinis sediminis TaxID=1652465 RepID=A0ABW5RFJ4_9BACL